MTRMDLNTAGAVCGSALACVCACRALGGWTGSHPQKKASCSRADRPSCCCSAAKLTILPAATLLPAAAALLTPSILLTRVGWPGVVDQVLRRHPGAGKAASEAADSYDGARMVPVTCNAAQINEVTPPPHTASSAFPLCSSAMKLGWSAPRCSSCHAKM
jgi:hypothetical protein